jgi:hypothetical protein
MFGVPLPPSDFAVMANQSAPVNSRRAWQFYPVMYSVVTGCGYVPLRRLWLS